MSAVAAPPAPVTVAPPARAPNAERPITADVRVEHAFRTAHRFPALDGLRGLSVLAVAWHHTADPAGPWGHAGVALFFAISGFLITTLLLREQDRAGDIALGRFYVRRALRIFPLYYAVLALYAVLVAAAERDSAAGRAFADNLPYFLTYTSNWFVSGEGGRVIFYFAWSLATEEQFYLFWPPLVRAGRGRRWVPVVGAGLLLTASLAAGAAIGGSHGVAGAPFALRVLASVSPAICLGCLLALAAHRPAGLRALSRALGDHRAVPALLAVCVAATAWGAPAVALYAAFAALVVAACLRSSAGPLLGWAPLASLGAVSYGVYLLHMLAFNVARAALPAAWQHPVVHFAAAAALAYVAARVSHHTFERRFLLLKERYR